MVFSDKPSFTRNDLYERFWTKTLIDVFLKDYDSVEFLKIGIDIYTIKKES